MRLFDPQERGINMDAIYKRRSIRKYTWGNVPYKMLLGFIKAGMNAPSAGNE